MSATRHDWHAMTTADCLKALDAKPDGLDAATAARRAAEHGPNQLPPAKRRTLLVRFLLQFHNMLIYILIVAAFVTAVLGHWLDSAVILGVVVVNAVIGVIQEGKAEKALDAIRDMLSPRAMVLRDGERRECDADGLVPGDIVLLRSGDRVPADLRLLKVRDLRVEEAALTGESVAVSKAHDAVVAGDAPLGDRVCMAYSSTLVRAGTAMGVVVGIGADTEIGRISQMIADVEQITTPLLRQMASFGKTLAAAVVLIAMATFAVAVLLRGYPLADGFMAAVGLAVAAIPEGLPAIMTVTLAIGVQRMAARNAIIRHLPAVETLGSVTVICSDKTGTLTRNEMTVTSVLLTESVLSVTGIGYGPEGEIDGHDRLVSSEPLERLLHAGALCNDSRVFRTEAGDWDLEGDPTEGALLAVAMKREDLDALLSRYPRVDTLPFESEHRFMATLHETPEAGRVIFLKGAPERVLEMCAKQLGPQGPEPLDHAHWERYMGEAADRGQRLLALAMKPAADGASAIDFEHVADGLLLLGVVGMIDPPSEEAVRAVAACQSAGIRVVMITGDHARTAVAIGRALGIGDEEGARAMTGADIEAMDERELAAAAQDVSVFARASPEHKLRLVRTLQEAGQVVAMTGDGVNDAPALKRADVGVAMGRRGTEVSKEASAMVLADDNFASIGHAVEEGRTVYDNLRKALLFLLPTNGGQAGIILLAVAAGMVLPITPVQILWVNMVTAVTLALALAFEPAERGVMNRPPRSPDAPILNRFLLWRIAFVSSLLIAVTLVLFQWHHVEGEEALARTIAVNTLVVCQVFYLLSVRVMHSPLTRLELASGNIWVPLAIAAILALQLGFTYLPPMQLLFDTHALGAMHWLLMVVAGLVVFFAVEVEKWLVSNWRTKG
jgi:magnesium-transporting ATPase (P-type)